MTFSTIDWEGVGNGVQVSTANAAVDDVVVGAGNTLVGSTEQLWNGMRTLLHNASGGGECRALKNVAAGYLAVGVPVRVMEDTNRTAEHVQIRDSGDSILAEWQWRAGFQIRLTSASQQQTASDTVVIGGFVWVELAVNKSGSAQPGWDPAANGGLGGFTATALADGQCQMRYFASWTDATPTAVLTDTCGAGTTPTYFGIGNRSGDGRASNVWNGPVHYSTDDTIAPLTVPPTVDPQLVTATPIFGGDTVTIEINAAHDSGSVDSIEHEQTGGPTTALSGVATGTATLTAPDGPLSLSYDFWAVKNGVAGARKSLTVPISEVTFAKPEITAVTAVPQSTSAGPTVQLLVEWTEGDGTVTTIAWGEPAPLSDPAIANPTLDTTGLAEGGYRFPVTITDDNGQGDSGHVDVAIVGVGDPIGLPVRLAHNITVVEGAATLRVSVIVPRDAAGEQWAIQAFDVMPGHNRSHGRGGLTGVSTIEVSRRVDGGELVVVRRASEVEMDDLGRATVEDLEVGGNIPYDYVARSTALVEGLELTSPDSELVTVTPNQAHSWLRCPSRPELDMRVVPRAVVQPRRNQAQAVYWPPMGEFPIIRQGAVHSLMGALDVWTETPADLAALLALVESGEDLFYAELPADGQRARTLYLRVTGEVAQDSPVHFRSLRRNVPFGFVEVPRP